MQAEYLLDNLKFISQGGAVSITVAAGLLAMSIGSWTLMVVKAIQTRRLKRSSTIFPARFWQASSATTDVHRYPFSGDSAPCAPEGISPAFVQSSMAAAMNGCSMKLENPFARLVMQGINAANHHNRYSTHRLGEARRYDEFVAHALHRIISQEALRLETGLTLLASVGSIAPFVGLFGTVWGIYHALGSIAVGGQATVDKVAGPVGEALIMTAAGLAVAIPAVLAYNTLIRDNRLLMGEIESFAHDLHTYLTTGAPLAAVQTTVMATNVDDPIPSRAPLNERDLSSGLQRATIAGVSS
jgi:biopolymer transport protein ExbB